jgi:acyl-CoA reductase-like NAD-dependent aldehyde dehydrogenase
MTSLQCISPGDGRIYAERPLAGEREIESALGAARMAAGEWRRLPIEERQELAARAVDLFVGRGEEIALEITHQMGRPIAHSPFEIAGFEERARHMIEIAPGALAEIRPPAKRGFERFIQREALGVVLVVAPWNYPYLTAVNTVVPALMAGNAVLLKHSSQTPLCSERIAEAFTNAGAPAGLVQALHLSHQGTLGLVASKGIDFVAFTGSVSGGHAVQRAAGEGFIATGLELGGKDPAYIRRDADLDYAVAGVVDGGFFNSGQSCCGVERVYVHQDRFEAFVEAASELVGRYQLGDPLDPETTLGPLVRSGAADWVREQVEEAIASGARKMIDENRFELNREGSAYLAPQILIDVDHSMRVMREESFGPVLGIMPVSDDGEAIRLMNDSPFGLTASIWSGDLERAVEIGREIRTGTVFLNRCDYLDPALAWTGVGDSGRGQSLSRLGYEVLTRPKSFHLRYEWPS